MIGSMPVVIWNIVNDVRVRFWSMSVSELEKSE